MPSILLSGNHALIAKWRRKQAILRTRRRRPDMYEKLDLSSKEDQKLLAELERELSRPPLPQPVACRRAELQDLDQMEVILKQAYSLAAHGQLFVAIIIIGLQTGQCLPLVRQRVPRADRRRRCAGIADGTGTARGAA